MRWRCIDSEWHRSGRSGAARYGPHRAASTGVGDRGALEEGRVCADLGVLDVEGRCVLHLDVQVRLAGVVGVADLAEDLPATDVLADLYAEAALGSMLAMAHDWRVMRADRGSFCFPEVDIRLAFTPGMARSSKPS